MSSTVSVVLSCAGVGARLGLGMTKALIKIAGKPLIQWQLELFKEVEDLRIVVGYQAKHIMDEVLKTRKNVVFINNHNYFETKTGASLYLGAKDAREYVVAWDGDLLVHPDDIADCLAPGVEYVGYSDISSDDAMFVHTDKNGDVVRFSRQNGDYEWTGPACIRKDKLAYTSENVFNQFENYLPMRGLKVRAMDIDTYDDYQRAIKFVESWG